MAAGLTLREAHFADFRRSFCACARELLTGEQLQPRLRLDAELGLGEIDRALLDQHESLQPFGMGNPQPLFAARGVTLAGEPRVMKEKHLSLVLRQGRNEYRAVWFNSASEPLPRLPWDVAFQIERNEWQGTVTPQIHIKAVRPSE
jgi:single-stranded-DNA-specific exonuclease